MTTMIERVARSICKEEYGIEDGWENQIPAARAAIEAMREPPVALFDAAIESNIVANDWHRVITAALEEKL